MVSYTWETLPPMTEERKAELRALADRPDSEIDLTDPDCPGLTDEQLEADWLPNPYCRNRKGAAAD